MLLSRRFNYQRLKHGLRQLKESLPQVNGLQDRGAKAVTPELVLNTVSESLAGR